MESIGINAIDIRLLQRDEIPLLWQIDRRQIVEDIYYLRDGELVLKPHRFHIRGWPPGEANIYTDILPRQSKAECPHDQGALRTSVCAQQSCSLIPHA